MEVSFSEIREREAKDADQPDQNVSADHYRGFGVYTDGNKMIAGVCGVIERVNKLISVVPLKSRYVPKIGDVVIGRVTDVSTYASIHG